MVVNAEVNALEFIVIGTTGQHPSPHWDLNLVADPADQTTGRGTVMVIGSGNQALRITDAESMLAVIDMVGVAIDGGCPAYLGGIGMRCASEENHREPASRSNHLLHLGIHAIGISAVIGWEARKEGKPIKVALLTLMLCKYWYYLPLRRIAKKNTVPRIGNAQATPTPPT